MKPKRTIPWVNLKDWEHLLKPGVRVRWRGATGEVFNTTLVQGRADARLRFEDGHEAEPCYIEQFVGVETDEEIITLSR